MPWLIGIDEAGYGPNLGPFVMTSVACRVVEAGGDFWKLLATAVRRPHERADGRLLIEDSKLVYTPKDGLARLEEGVLATVLPLGGRDPFTLSEGLQSVCRAALTELEREAWFTGTTPLPLAALRGPLAEAARSFVQACDGTAIQWGLVRSVIVCPARFNLLLDQWQTKGAVLGQALTELLRANLDAANDAAPIFIRVDKHGGRNTYAAMLQDAVPEGFVFAYEESMERSTYSIQGLGRDVRITFQPRADAEDFRVALASMVSKYLREVLMHEFNGFWKTHVPDLTPTAGYPTDAKRFYAAIRPAMNKLGLCPDQVWRRK